MGRRDRSGHSVQSDDDPVVVDPESRRVERWRVHVLTAAGYPFAEAQRLAMNGHVDLHVACEILRGGCSLEHALEILL